jgi:hypothetical protein
VKGSKEVLFLSIYLNNSYNVQAIISIVNRWSRNRVVCLNFATLQCYR